MGDNRGRRSQVGTFPRRPIKVEFSVHSSVSRFPFYAGSAQVRVICVRIPGRVAANAA